MRSFSYRARFERGDKRGIVVSFPDVPEAITQGRDLADARRRAEEALGMALLTYSVRGLSLPKARAGRGSALITVAPDVAAKLAVLDAFLKSGLSKSELARRVGKDEKEIRRVLDPRHATKLSSLTPVLDALGKRLVVGVIDAEAA